ncbi:Tub-domain-containing protein [Neocallimastix lanati (nom. inval.)]|nr:Tub-domain-containing protein [Neocallimastix sp. JGI-2020a]
MPDLENRQIEKKYQRETQKKNNNTSMNNLIQPAPKVIAFNNNNKSKHELMFVPLNKIDEINENENKEEEIKNIKLNSENKINANNKNKLIKNNHLFKEGFDSKSDEQNKNINKKKEEEEEENIDGSDYSESRPMLKNTYKKENDKINKKKISIRFGKKKEDDLSNDEINKIKLNKKENNNNNSSKEYNFEKETEEIEKLQINNNDRKFNFLDALPSSNYSTYKRIEKGHILRCRVIRKVGKINHIHPEYYLINDDTDEFILAARRRKNIKKMDYIITTDENSFTKTSSGYVGKLIVKQDKFTLYNAENYDPTLPDKGLYESASIFYNRNSSPREMFIALPALHLEHGSSKYSKDFLADAKSNNTDKIIILRNNPPRWNEITQSHCLNFSGRVTQPSIKNFQLIYDKGNSYMKCFGFSYDDSQKFEPISVDNPILLQFGRCGPNNFTLDIRYPLTPLEAFAISLTTFEAFDTLY